MIITCCSISIKYVRDKEKLELSKIDYYLLLKSSSSVVLLFVVPEHICVPKLVVSVKLV